MRQKLAGLKLWVFVFAAVLAGRTQQAPVTSGDDSRTTLNEPSRVQPVILLAGTEISIRIADHVNSKHNHTGDLLTGIVDPSVLIDNHVVIPRGTEAHVRLMEDRKGGHIRGKAEVRLELIGLVMNDEKLDVDSDEYRKKQGALAGKLKGVQGAGENSGASAATSVTPEGGIVGPILAVFRPATIDIPAGTRIPFKLMSPFTTGDPVDARASLKSSR